MDCDSTPVVQLFSMAYLKKKRCKHNKKNNKNI
jgi:hypothetical protein